jgi:ABC-type lipoprotein release transport system permease subunit
MAGTPVRTKGTSFSTSLKLGFFLALRQIRRSSKATTALIIFVMTLTFLNLVVVRGILVGLIQGSVEVYSKYYSGDIFISNLPKKSYIENSQSIISIVKGLPWVDTYTARYVESGSVEANYKTRVRLTDDPNVAGGVVAGINPEMEDKATGISSKIVEGSYLTSRDTDSIIIGANMLKKYLDIDSPGLNLLENVKVGDRVRLTVNGNTKEVILKGVIKSKTDLDQRILMLDQSLRPLIGRGDYNVDEIAIVLKPGSDPLVVKEALLKSGVGATVRVQTFEESLPKFIKDMIDTFAILGNVVGSIGLVVASITIFIVIFINAITRRKFIGILKGIGISSRSIEISYIFQSIFYASFGIAVGLFILYGLLVPYITAHPINFPFSDGILVAEVPNTALRALFLIVATIISGFIPARIVVKRNTLDSILGR